MEKTLELSADSLDEMAHILYHFARTMKHHYPRFEKVELVGCVGASHNVEYEYRCVTHWRIFTP